MSTYHYDTKGAGFPAAGGWGTYLALMWDGTDVDGKTYSETGTKTYWASPDGSNWIQATENIEVILPSTYYILNSIIESQINNEGWTDLYLTLTDPDAGSTQLDVRKFPTYHPTDRRYVHGEWPMTRHRFMSNTEQRVLHASAKTGQELRLTYANQTTEVVEQFAIHYDQVLGSQYAFDLPKEVLIGWEGGNTLVGIKQKWKYKTDPLITSQRGLYATLQITLVAASTTDLAVPNATSGVAPSTSTFSSPSQKFNSFEDGDECPPLPPTIYPAPPSVDPPLPLPDTDSDGADGGGDGSGGGPDGPIPNPSPGPGEPIPIPITPECPPGTQLNPNNNSCETVPGLEDGTKITFKTQTIRVGELFTSSSCAYRVDACTQPTYYQRNCVHGGFSYVSEWPLTFRKTRETDPRPQWYIKERGCYSQSPGYLNTNILDSYSVTPDWQSAIWAWFEGSGKARLPTSDSQMGTNVGCIYGTTKIGSPDEPGYELVQITSTDSGVVLWQSSNYIPHTQCRDWEENNPITQERIDGYLQSLNEDTYIEKNSSVPKDWSDNPTANLDAYFKSSVKNSVSGNSANFPTYHPSTRTYTGSDWSTKRFGGALTKREQTLRLSSKAVSSGGKLQLSFANQPDSVARSILQHYHEMTGGFSSFNLSESILKDWDSIYRSTLKGAEWTYDAAPQVTTSHPGYSTTSVRLLLTKAAQEAKSTKKDPVGPPKPPECEPTPEPLPEPGPGDPIEFKSTVRIQIIIDNSGSMEFIQSQLEEMRDTVLKECLLPFYKNDEALYNNGVRVIGMNSIGFEQTYKAAYWDSTFGDDPGEPTTNIINLIFQDEAHPVYTAGTWTINRPPSNTFVSDMSTLNTRFSNYSQPGLEYHPKQKYGPGYMRTNIFQTIIDSTEGQYFRSLMKAVENGEGSYTGDLSTKKWSEIGYTYDVPYKDDVYFYMNMIIDAINKLGYNAPSCKRGG